MTQSVGPNAYSCCLNIETTLTQPVWKEVTKKCSSSGLDTILMIKNNIHDSLELVLDCVHHLCYSSLILIFFPKMHEVFRSEWITNDWFQQTWNNWFIENKVKWIEWCFSGYKFMIRHMYKNYCQHIVWTGMTVQKGRNVMKFQKFPINFM